jgi:hypothetical protein
MTNQAAELDPITLNEMCRATIAALPTEAGASVDEIVEQRRAALIAVASLRPRNPVEAMLAARIIAAHNAGMECFRRAAIPDTADAMALRLHSKAISLANLAVRLHRELQKLQVEVSAYPVPAGMAEAEAELAPPPAKPVAPTQPAPAAALPERLDARVTNDLVMPAPFTAPTALAA